MTTTERGLFEQLEDYLNPGEKAGKEAEAIIRKFEQRLAEAQEYSIALQRAIEHFCRGIELPEEMAKSCPHHAKMLNEKLAEEQNEPSIEVDGIRVDAQWVRNMRGQHAEMDFKLQKLEAGQMAEPVAWFYDNPHIIHKGFQLGAERPDERACWTPLYIHPASQEARAGVPEGWKLVPIEPTEEMVAAIMHETDAPHPIWARDAYKSMLAAAPSRQEG